MSTKVFFLLFAILLCGCATNDPVSSGSVSLSKNNIPSEHGLWYYLPKTIIKVEIIAEKEVAKAGPFYRFSQRFLNISDVITEDREGWHIIGASISTYGIADENKLFKVSTEGTPGMAALSLTTDGVLRSVNLPHLEKFNNQISFEQLPSKIISLENINFNDVPFTEDQLIKSSTTAMAEEVSKEIYRLRQLKSRIIKGEVKFSPDAGSFEQMMAELEKLEQSYISLFTGKVEKQTVKRVYDFIPDDFRSVIALNYTFDSRKFLFCSR